MSTYLLDSTVLIAHIRGKDQGGLLARLRGGGHTLGTSCVNVAEVIRGLRPNEQKTAMFLLERLRYLATGREAAFRAGRYAAEWSRRGRTIELPDALVAGTARAHGAIVVTENIKDFPMRDIRVELPSPIE